MRRAVVFALQAVGATVDRAALPGAANNLHVSRGLIMLLSTSSVRRFPN
jgi:hypothetical protein